MSSALTHVHRESTGFPTDSYATVRILCQPQGVFTPAMSLQGHISLSLTLGAGAEISGVRNCSEWGFSVDRGQAASIHGVPLAVAPVPRRGFSSDIPPRAC